MVCRLPHPTWISFHCLPHISRPATKRVISKQDFCQETYTAAKEELCLVVVRDTLDMAGIGIFQWWIFTCFGVVGIWYMPAIPNVESSPALAKLQKLLTPLLLPNQWPLLQTKEIETNLVVFFTDLVVAVYRSYLQSIWNSGRLWNLKKTFLEKSFFTKIWLPCWNSALIHLEGTKTFWKYWKCLYLIFVTCWGFCHLAFLISSSSTSRCCLTSSEDEGV